MTHIFLSSAGLNGQNVLSMSKNLHCDYRKFVTVFGLTCILGVLPVLLTVYS